MGDTLSHDGTTTDLGTLLGVVSTWLHENPEDDRRDAVLRSYGQLLGLLHPSSPLYNAQPDRVMSSLLNLKEVAQLAGVTQACASNWRARYKDFPRNVSGRDTQPLFDRGEVQAWITKHQQNPRTRRTNP